jgi:hypothetical protein
MPDWNAGFVPSTSVLEIFLRGTITFLVLMAMMRAADTPGSARPADWGSPMSSSWCFPPGRRRSSPAWGRKPTSSQTASCWQPRSFSGAWYWTLSPTDGPAWAASSGPPRLLIEDGRLNHKVMRGN